MSKAKIATERIDGVWSAAPTPFSDDWSLDVESLRRMVDHHIRLGVKGLFVCGTAGEGPMMTEADKARVIEEAKGRSGDRLLVAAQVTDNSPARVLDNISRAASAGADIAVVAHPYFMLNPTTENVTNFYLECVRGSPLPVGLYDRGAHSPYGVPLESLKRICLEPNLIMVKDSSADMARAKIALEAKAARPELRLLTGYEFGCVDYIKAGYDGLLFGGAVFNGHMAGLILSAARKADYVHAQTLQDRMNELMWRVFGGKDCSCWLTGQKQLLVEMGLFRTSLNHYRYPLTDSCARGIKMAVKEYQQELFPWTAST